MKRLGWVVLSAWAMPAVAQTWVEAAVDHQRYSRGFPSANTHSVSASHRSEARTVYGELQRFERFGLIESQSTVGLYEQVTATGQLHLEASGTPDAVIKPRFAGYAGWYQALPEGWAVEPGLQIIRYQTVDVRKQSMLVEKYAGAWRWAAALARIELQSESELNYRLQGDWFYGERSRLGAGVAWGDDQESLPNGVLKTPVRSAFVGGQHEVSSAWSLTWSLQQVDQGDLYRQRGGRFGVRYHF